MSCGVALALSLLLSDPAVAASAAMPPITADAPASVASEPLFADIVTTSGRLKTIVDGWIADGHADQAGFWTSADYTTFKTEAEALAARDMQGHLVLKERGADGDLKCILRGISEDMPKRLAAIDAAPNPAERRLSLEELSHLLEDNAAVITSPPAPEV